VRVFDSDEFRNLSLKPDESYRLYQGNSQEGLEGLAKQLRKGEGAFDGNVSGVSVTTLPAPVIVSGAFDNPATIEQMVDFYSVLKEEASHL
jgi:hypothetical protein